MGHSLNDLISGNSQVQKLRKEIGGRSKDPKFAVSDVMVPLNGPASRKLQFVDLVMEGGGVLGIGLVGYIAGLE